METYDLVSLDKLHMLFQLSVFLVFLYFHKWYKCDLFADQAPSRMARRNYSFLMLSDFFYDVPRKLKLVFYISDFCHYLLAQLKQ